MQRGKFTFRDAIYNLMQHDDTKNKYYDLDYIENQAYLLEFELEYLKEKARKNRRGKKWNSHRGTENLRIITSNV